MSATDLRIRVVPAIGDVAAADWDACANPHRRASTTAGNGFSRLANCPEARAELPARAATAGAPHDAESTSPGSGARPVDPGPQDAAPIAPPQAESVSQEQAFNPFIAHDFLRALEASGSATARAGWQPQHLVAEDAGGGVLGVAPCYLKSHS